MARHSCYDTVTQRFSGAGLPEVIAAATGAHPQLILAGVEAGLPVFCEKQVAEACALSRSEHRPVTMKEVRA
jgi:hypothetical protein